MLPHRGVSPRPNSSNEAPIPARRTCAECAHCKWVFGTFGGFHCTEPANATDGKPMRVPSQSYGCDRFARTSNRRSV